MVEVGGRNEVNITHNGATQNYILQFGEKSEVKTRDQKKEEKKNVITERWGNISPAHSYPTIVLC